MTWMTHFRYVDRIATSLEFYLFIDISEDFVATIFCLEDGDGRFLQNVNRLTDCTR